MSQTIRNGVSTEIALQAGQTLLAVAVTGSYNASIIAGADLGATTDFSGASVPNGALPDAGAYEWH